MATRKGLVAKKGSFPAQNDDEKESRRQKIEFSTPKRRREQGSSPKNEVSRLKMATRKGLVAKKGSFLAQSGDENRSRRQKSDFLNSKRRREQVSPTKIRLPHLKIATKMLSSTKNKIPSSSIDEKGFGFLTCETPNNYNFKVFIGV
ncbi:hypothetical protein [Caldifermentibacillus hisashii]|uniref:hypothetical protein n=1 Tax=Caldifermentibacillus hisashii TaxID=996558 RepID=UPI0022B9C3E3|nr:hypothetical protein [Caldifermentibacillus hisashii]